jgi:hypothetical protein
LLLLWSAAPVTGVSDLPGAEGATVSSLRYLLPALAAALTALALTSRERLPQRRAVTAALALALGLNVWQLFDLGFPAVPSPQAVLAGALTGGGLGYVAGARVAWPRVQHRRLALGGPLVAGAALAVAAPGVVDRHRRMPVFDAPLLDLFSGPAADGRPIAMAPTVTALLSGNRLKRRVDAIPRRASCYSVQAMARRGWVVVGDSTADELFGPSSVPGCVHGWTPAFALRGYKIFGRGSAPGD